LIGQKEERGEVYIHLFSQPSSNTHYITQHGY
jgi:hypothetical protein